MPGTSYDYLQLPDYDVLRVLGRGGFGEVLLARHRVIGRMVAVKHIPVRLLADADALARFKREALALARVQHPAVVAAYDLRVTPGGSVLLMEYVPGESLRETLDAGRLPAAATIAILADVAAALDAAAAVGVVHRDVKPANVFVLPGGRAKLGDFGIARIAEPDIFRTSEGMLTGTPAYLAPEVLEPGHQPDRHGDDYAFAVMAYEALVGRLPFEGEGLSLLGQHGYATPTSPAAVVPGFPPDAAAALLAGLAKDPAQRPGAGDLVNRLRAVPETAWPATLTAPIGSQRQPAPLPAHAPVIAALPGTPPASRRRRRQVLLTAGGLVVLAAAALAVTGPLTDDELSVEAATVTVDAAEGSCPQASFVFTARIDTNGEPGRLRLRWLQPDGVRTDITSLDVTSGGSPVTATLRFDVAGADPLSGAARLEVLSPDETTAAPVEVSYTCP